MFDRQRLGKKSITHPLSQDSVFWLLAYGLGTILIGSNIATPLYVVYQSRWHFSTGVLTLIFVVYIAGLLASSLVAGRLSDRIGRRRVLLPALFLSVGGSLIFVLEQGVPWLLAARVLQGLAAGGFTAPVTAAIIEMEPGGDRRRAALTSSTATALGLALGPLLSGILVQYAPWPTYLIYFVYLVLLVPAIVGIWWLPLDMVSRSTPFRWNFSFSIPSSIVPPFSLACAAFGVGWVVTALLLSLGPSFVVFVLHLNNLHNQAVAGLLLFLFFTASSVSQLLLRELSEDGAMNLGIHLVVFGMLVVLTGVLFQFLPLFLVGLLMAGAGQGLSCMGGLARVNRIAPPTRRGEILAVFYLIVYLVAGILVLLTGFAVAGIGLYWATLWLTTLILLVTVALGRILSQSIYEEDTHTSIP